MKDSEKPTRQVIVRTTIEGTHQWSNCNLEEVMYLKNKHRHIFHIEAHKEVTHNDREVEIIMFKRQIGEFLETFNGNFGDMSCEDIAQAIMWKFDCSYVQVLEDNENGASIKK